ncbi:galactokinase [Pilobolus umbonatus]|nr:galactokinase [Pilobolus umbonatus]
MDSSVPVYDSLDKIYNSSALAKEGERYNELIAAFESTHGRKAEFIVRAPGRVNLIGEHVDYCGFGVLPMAIERDVVIVGASTADDSKVRLSNSNHQKYATREFEYEGKEKVVTIDATKLEWTNYFKCGYKGILEKFQLDQPRGLFLVVDGNVPAGGGLSSSAAFVCASALAVVTANQLTISKTELTEIAISAERNVGVNSGGMDQSASVLSEKDYALHVEFVPNLHTHLVPLPKTTPKLVFVIANTLITVDKFVTAPRHYNLRVVETHLAALYLAKALHLPPVDTLREVFDLYYKDSPLSEVDRFADLLSKATELFPKDNTNNNGYTLQEVADMLETSKEDIQDRYMTRFPIETDYFRILHRTKHVLSEAARVIEFINTCASADDSVLTQLGDLMNASQISCAEQFDCSCPEIKQMCEIASKYGAYGSRLTGAGWGGCTVHLITEDKVPALIKALKDEYYRKMYPDISEKVLEDAIVLTQPCCGAGVFTGF